MSGREMAYLIALGVALGFGVWFIVPSDKPKLLILVVVECAFLLVTSYQAWVLNKRRGSRHGGA
jgi:hypothetical protein